jgi:hypothetical protein
MKGMPRQAHRCRELMQFLDAVRKEVTPLAPTMFDECIVDIHQNASPIFYYALFDATATMHLLMHSELRCGWKPLFVSKYISRYS